MFASLRAVAPRRRFAAALHSRFRPIGACAWLLAALLGTLAGQASRAAAQTTPAQAAPAPAPAAPAPESPAYHKAIDDAVLEFRAGHWEEARALFGRAHELEPSARTLRGLGMTAYELRMYVQSIRELDAALRETRKPLDPTMRAAADALISKARAFTARVTITPIPATAALIIDGRHPQPEADGSLLLDAGTHVVNASADGYKPANLRFSVEGGHDQVLQLPLEPLLAITAVPAIDPLHPAPVAKPEPIATPAPLPPPAPPPRAKPDSTVNTLAWVTLGGAVAFGTGAAVTWLIGDKAYDDLAKDCGTTQTCLQSQVDDSGVANMDTLTSVFLGVAAASGVASVVLFAVSFGNAAADEHADADVGGVRAGVQLGLAPSGLRVSGAF